MYKDSIRSIARPISGVSARSLSTTKSFSGSENVAPTSKVEAQTPRHSFKNAAVKISTLSVRTSSTSVISSQKPVLKPVSKPFCCGAYCARAAAQENIIVVPKAPPIERTAQAAQKTAPKGVAQKKEVVPMKEVAPKMDVEPAEVVLRSKLVEIDPSAFVAASKDRCTAQSAATPPRVAYPVAQALASLGECARVHTVMTAPAQDAAPPAVSVSRLPVFDPWTKHYDVVDTAPLSQVDGHHAWKDIAQKELTDVCRVHAHLVDVTNRARQLAPETRVKSVVRPGLVSAKTPARNTAQKLMPGQRAALQKKAVSMAACAVKSRKQFRFNETVEVVYLPYCEEWQQSRKAVAWHDKYDMVHLRPDADMLNAPAVDLLEYLALEAEISAAFYNAAGNYERYNSGRGASVKHLLRHNMNIRQFLLSVVHVAPELTDAAVALFPRYPEAHELYDLPPWQLASNASDSKRFHRECASLNSFSPKFIR